MCRCTPHKRTPWCGAPGCEAPPRRISQTVADIIPDEVHSVEDLAKIRRAIEAARERRFTADPGRYIELDR